LVTSISNIYEYLDSEAYRVLFDYGMFSFPLDVEMLANKLNASIHYISQEQMLLLQEINLEKKLSDGCVITIDGINYKIFLNGNNSKGRIRFTIAHEIKHIIFDDKDNNEDDESLTNHFARILLAPPVILDYYDCSSVNDIIKQFGVSNEVAKYILDARTKRNNIFGNNIIFDYEKDYFESFLKSLTRRK